MTIRSSKPAVFHPRTPVLARESEASEKRSKELTFNPKSFLMKVGDRTVTGKYHKNQVVFSQGEGADAIFYIQKGNVKLSVVSKSGKEGVIAILGSTDFFGEACLTGQVVRIGTATSLDESSIVRISKGEMVRVLHNEQAFSEVFTAYLLSRIVRVEEDLLDQLFNSSEKRLARILLLLANFGKEQNTEPILPKISQETLAEMVGTTRPRVNFFLNKFRKLGFIEYDGGLIVHRSLLTVVLHD